MSESKSPVCGDVWLKLQQIIYFHNLLKCYEDDKTEGRPRSSEKTFPTPGKCSQSSVSSITHCWPVSRWRRSIILPLN